MERNTEVISTLERLLFITTREWTYFEGAAHGNTVFDFYVYDAASKTRVDVLSAQELEPAFREERDLAFEKLREHDSFNSFEEFTPDDVSLTLYRPFYDGSGRLKLELQFTASTAYGASDGQWSSYTYSVRLTSPRIPAALQEFVSPPDALATYLAATGTARRMGWSTVGPSPATRAWLRDVVVQR
ncbi:hypothetical protein D7V97_10075 [Corallococcus sp. CA053C]|uniref:hypothetical protein n=1 Tax=Corallococcus sp. CA053C TaxID=2316732 RepID=UPI000EA0315E|nr:hypothetical protein [Corallococcus sp. CA053C]RKH11882.1 hypothetical protein D7V97_10075 [Corallococcus sp. CA053C]